VAAWHGLLIDMPGAILLEQTPHLAARWDSKGVSEKSYQDDVAFDAAHRGCSARRKRHSWGWMTDSEELLLELLVVASQPLVPRLLDEHNLETGRRYLVLSGLPRTRASLECAA
jgi:hypothetical protein